MTKPPAPPPEAHEAHPAGAVRGPTPVPEVDSASEDTQTRLRLFFESGRDGLTLVDGKKLSLDIQNSNLKGYGEA